MKRSIVKNIEKARDAGFNIEMHYIGVESVDICKERIRHRVKNGGHGIPDEVTMWMLVFWIHLRRLL